MACYICKSNKYINILSKPSIPIWDGSGKNRKLFPCDLRQCTECGHVYEEVTAELLEELNNIYQSDYAAASTIPSSDSWGMERAKAFLDRSNYNQYDSAIEIGCADGYLLKFLEENGYKKLIGIEPSLKASSKVGVIELVKTFVNEQTFLGRVSLIFSNAVFEHIRDINSVLKFVKNSLNAGGELFFAVPNAQREVESGDPALFIHEHLHYYTKDSILYLMESNGFKIKSIEQDCSAFYVSAYSIDNIHISLKDVSLYGNYSNLLDIRINKFNKVVSEYKNIIIHGANNKLNNLLGWSENDFSFTLVDNDKYKHGSIFFGKEVFPLDELNMSDYDCVVIIPTCFYKAIHSQYVDYGFSGKFYQA